MEKLEFGETAVLENGKEFICFKTLTEDGVDYAYLVSNYKPVEVRFAKQTIVNGELLLEIVEDQDLKERLLELFQSGMTK